MPATASFAFTAGASGTGTLTIDADGAGRSSAAASRCASSGTSSRRPSRCHSTSNLSEGSAPTQACQAREGRNGWRSAPGHQGSRRSFWRRAGSRLASWRTTVGRRPSDPGARRGRRRRVGTEQVLVPVADQIVDVRRPGLELHERHRVRRVDQDLRSILAEQRPRCRPSQRFRRPETASR